MTTFLLLQKAPVPKLTELFAADKRPVVVHNLVQHNNIFIKNNGDKMSSDVDRSRDSLSPLLVNNSSDWEQRSFNIRAENTYFRKSPRDITRDLLTRVDSRSRDHVSWRQDEARDTTPINVPVRIRS